MYINLNEAKIFVHTVVYMYIFVFCIKSTCIR